MRGGLLNWLLVLRLAQSDSLILNPLNLNLNLAVSSWLVFNISVLCTLNFASIFGVNKYFGALHLNHWVLTPNSKLATHNPLNLNLNLAISN